MKKWIIIVMIQKYKFTGLQTVALWGNWVIETLGPSARISRTATVLQLHVTFTRLSFYQIQ